MLQRQALACGNMNEELQTVFQAVELLTMSKTAH
jgi:hypothetical protein